MWGERMNRNILEKEMQLVIKHKNKCFTSLIIRGIQIQEHIVKKLNYETKNLKTKFKKVPVLRADWGESRGGMK